MNCSGKEKNKLQLNTHQLHLSKQPATRKVPLNRTRQKPKLIPAVCLGSAHQSALGRLHAEVTVAVGSQVSGTVPQKITGDTAPAGAGGLGAGRTWVTCFSVSAPGGKREDAMAAAWCARSEVEPGADGNTEAEVGGG